jgi:hypothetical protein
VGEMRRDEPVADYSLSAARLWRAAAD